MRRLRAGAPRHTGKMTQRAFPRPPHLPRAVCLFALDRATGRLLARTLNLLAPDRVCLAVFFAPFWGRQTPGQVSPQRLPCGILLHAVLPVVKLRCSVLLGTPQRAGGDTARAGTSNPPNAGGHRWNPGTAGQPRLLRERRGFRHVRQVSAV